MSNYAGKKIAVLRGYPRLIDGESTSVEELFNWGKKNDVEFHTYYLHAEWKRKKPEYKDGYKHEHTIFNKSMIEEISEEINSKYDLVILINPAKPHSGLKPIDVLAFHKLYLSLTPVKIQIQLTSFVKAINETPFCWSYINHSDAVFNWSTDSWYMNSMVKKLPSKKDRALPVHMWMNILDYKDFSKNEERDLNLTYVGRFVLYKGPKRLLNISEAVNSNGIKPVIYGMDPSIGCKKMMLDHPNCNNLLNPKAPRNENPIVDTYGRIEREEVLNIFNKSLFACTLFKYKSEIDKSFYGDRLEYTMIEAIMAGSILVVDKEWAETCKTIDGTKYIDIPNFAIYMDESYPGDAIQKMKEVAADPELQRKYRETAFNTIVKEYDSSIAIPKWLNALFSITKDPYKFSTDKELVKYLTDSDELSEKFVEIYEDGNLIPMTSKTISQGKISIYTGKSGKAIREYQGGTQ